MVGLMDRLNAGVDITAIADPRVEEIKQQLKEAGRDPEKIAFYTDADEMLSKETLDGAMIGTRCSLHASMAVKVIDRGLPLFLEKPIATNMNDLVMLRDAAKRAKSDVVVSFPLRVSPLVKLAKEIVDSGKIGTVEHVEAWNNVPYGWCYYQMWYRDENETQGLFLQKTTHDFDYINHILEARPMQVCAMTSKRVYTGNHPAGLKCDECEEQDSCLESPFHAYFTKAEKERVEASNLMCGFAEDTGNEDSGSSIVMYESGMHVCYTQNFFARKTAGKRGASLFGYKGTIEFDWYTDELKVHMHHTPRLESYKTDTTNMAHGGGDLVLLDSFVRIIKGERKSVAPLQAGLLSVLMCLKAKESAETRTFQDIKWPDE